MIRFLSVGIFSCLSIASSASGSDKAGAYLEPTAPYNSDISGNYQKQVFLCLLGDPYLDLWMLSLPGGHLPEYAIAIGRELREGQQLELSKRVVIFAKVEKPIAPFAWKPTRSNEKSADCPSLSYNITVEISSESAERITATWFSAMNTVEHIKPEQIMNDATTFEFYAGGRAGKARDPNRGIALLMYQTGNCLVNYAQSNLNDRQEVLNQCLALNENLRKRLR
jgi:hypothetical protein